MSSSDARVESVSLAHAASRQSASIAIAPNAPAPIFSLDRRADDERADPTASSLSRTDAFDRDRVVGRRDDSDAPADGFAVHAHDDGFRRFDHRADDAGEAHEERLSLNRVADRRQFVERRTGAERARAVAPNDDDADVGADTHVAIDTGQVAQHRRRKGVALRMTEADVGDAVVHQRRHVAAASSGACWPSVMSRAVRRRH